MKWNYSSSEYSSTGYEDDMNFLSAVDKSFYYSLSAEEQDEVINKILNIYKGKNIFPITYFNLEGVMGEISRCIEYEPVIKDNVVNCGAGVGTALCNFLFPNLYTAYNSCTGGGLLGTYKSCEDKFNNDEVFTRIIKFAINSCEGGVVPTNIMAGMRMVGAIPTNFRPMNAKALYERYCPENGVIFDFACGFGGRLLGALSSKKNFRYVGVEPNTETFNNLHVLGDYIEKVTNRTDSYKIFKIGSEDFKANNNIFDFSFSSPPYFDLEVYCDEPTQCYNRYPDLFLWLDKYVRVTIENTYAMLKPGSYYAVNIADFSTGTRIINYVDIWKNYAEKAGFEYVEDLHLKLTVRTGVKKENKASKGKKERIMVFRKR